MGALGTASWGGTSDPSSPMRSRGETVVKGSSSFPSTHVQPTDTPLDPFILISTTRRC